MGELPIVFLVLASLGITYGWQPDQASSDSTAVEYIVQLSPAELRAIRPGQPIASVIDPEVRGHVSKVLIRVGTTPPPRILPPSLAADRVAVQRPDPQSSGRSTFSIPQSLQESAGNLAREATDDVRANLDHAGRELQDQLSSQLRDGLNRLRGAEPASRETAQVATPQTRFPTTTTDPSASAGQGPANFAFGSSSSLNPLNSSSSSTERSSQQPSPRLTPPNFVGSSADQGLGSQATSAPTTSLPSTTPSARNNRWNPFSGQNRNTSAALVTDNSASQSGLTTSQRFGRSPTNVPSSGNGGLGGNQNNQVLSQWEQTQLDQARHAAAGQNQPGQFANHSPQPGISLGPPSAGSGQPRTTTAPARRDPSLTAEQIAAGGWGFDQFGNLLDRQGRRIDLAPPAARDRVAANGGLAGPQLQPPQNRATRTSPPGNFGPQPAATHLANPHTVARSNQAHPGYSHPGYPGANQSNQLPGYPSNQRPGQPYPVAPPNGTYVAANGQPFGPGYPPLVGNPAYASAAYPGQLAPPTTNAASVRSAAPAPTPRSSTDLAPRRVSSADAREAQVSSSKRAKTSRSQFVFNVIFLASCMGNLYLIGWIVRVHRRLRQRIASGRIEPTQMAA